MAISELPRKRLPSKPSEEHLRKEAKRFAREHHARLAEAQRRVAAEYGAKNWAELMRMAKSGAAAHPGNAAPLSALCEGAKRGDSDAVKLMLARGESAAGREGEASPLWHACASEAPAPARLAIVRMLLEAGADPRRGAAADGTALHIAARRGPLAIVETLIGAGALTWYTDRAASGRSTTRASETLPTRMKSLRCSTALSSAIRCSAARLTPFMAAGRRQQSELDADDAGEYCRDRSRDDRSAG